MIELTLPSIRTRTWLLKMPISLRTVTEVPASGTSAVEMYFCHKCMIMSAWRMTSKGERSGSVLPSSRVSWCRALRVSASQHWVSQTFVTVSPNPRLTCRELSQGSPCRSCRREP